MGVRAEAVVFDVDDTLYDLAEPYREAYAACFAERYDLPVDELFVLSRDKSDVALELLTAGKITAEDHKVLRVQWTFAEFGVEVSREEALAFQDAYASAQERIALYPEAIAMLDAVARSGVPCGVMSNGDAAHQQKKLDLLGLSRWVDDAHVVLSGDYGANKPSPILYEAMERKLGVAGDGVWYVGDTYETDVVGAKRAGWSCLWLDVRGRAVPAVAERPDATVHSVEAMRAFVEELVIAS